MDLQKKEAGGFEKIKNHLERLEVLGDIYEDLSNKTYPDKQERDIAKLKMELIKKEMLLLNYCIDTDLGKISIE